MRLISLILLTALFLTGCSQSEEIKVASQLAKCEMIRTPNSVNLDFRPVPRWNYSSGLQLYAMLKLAHYTGDREMADYVYAYADSLIDEKGIIYGYELDEYNIDNVNAGKLLFDLYDETGEERFRIAADTLRSQMRSHPRTAEGGWWHKKVYEHQMWLDGLYMGAPFVAQWAERNNENVGWDIMRQFIIVGNHTYDTGTSLYRHGWDESRSMCWADSITGQSQHAWGRANGWYMMAMADVLEIVNDTVQGRADVLTIFNNLAEALLSVRDEETGLWYQVLDCPGYDGNYIESSCSAMFIYAFLKGARLGLLPESFATIGKEAYQQFLNKFIEEDEGGMTTITDCCSVAGLGGKNMRDGSFEYYISEPIRNNDPKVIGPFILASLEMDLAK
ncbi:MAG: glycoside hydrolase family 88 protein [Marinilabiliaceae bacterium]|nr:glycoside hydrolase family 88 protein [Marinilabiliaceae bacterium]